MAKLIKYARVTGTVLSVLRVVLLVVSGLAALALLVGIGVAQPVADFVARHPGGSATLNSGAVQFTVASSALTLTAGNIRWLCVAFLVILAVIAAIALRLIGLFAAMMVEMRQGHPFSPAMTARVRRIAGAIFVYAFVTPLIPFAVTGFIVRALGASAVLSGAGVHIGYQYNVNGLAVLAGVMVLLLSLVFDYGAQLQKESDETL